MEHSVAAVAAPPIAAVILTVVHGGFALGRSKQGPRGAEFNKIVDALLREGWMEENSAFLRVFSSVWFPAASPEQIKWYASLFRTSISIENAIMNRGAVADIDVVELLPKVSALRSCCTVVTTMRRPLRKGVGSQERSRTPGS